MKIKVVMLFVILLLFLVNYISALYVPDDNKAVFGHVMTIKEIKAPQLSPGEQGILSITLKNNGKYEVNDIEIGLTLPSEFQFYQDISSIKISGIKSGQEKGINYRIIAAPNSKEGIYKANMTVDYTSHLGANAINVGQNQEDNFNLGLIIKNDPSMFVIFDNSEIYDRNGVGGVTLKLVNNGTTDIKFLTANLKESPEYEIISDPNYYVGDLDSNDYQSVVFKLKLNGEYKEINLPLSINYKDSLNQQYNKDVNVKLKIRNATESGKTNNNYFYYIVAGILILIIIVIIVYVRSKRKRKG